MLFRSFFLIFAYSNASLRTVEGNTYVARFNRIDGVNPGGDVKMSGIKVGTIKGVTIDPKTYVAVVDFTVDRAIQLPTDSSAEIASEGLLGGKYLSLVPGAGDELRAAPNLRTAKTVGEAREQRMRFAGLASSASAVRSKTSPKKTSSPT